MQTFIGKQYLMMDIAGSFGLDKETWDTRLDWFEKNESNLESLITNAETPALFYAGTKAWRATQAGEHSGFPISLDATSSGLQILACITGDRKAAELCNVVDMGFRCDAYTILYDRILAKIGQNSKIKREDTKKAIMTAFYSSKAEPRRVFGEDLVPIFEETMEENAPACWELNQAFMDIWDPTAYYNGWSMPDGFIVRIKVMTPVTESYNFLNEPREIIRFVNAPMKEGRSLGANVTHSIDGLIVREMANRCMYDREKIDNLNSLMYGMTRFSDSKPIEKMTRIIQTKRLWKAYENSGFLSARILDYIDSDTLEYVDPNEIRKLLASLPDKPFNILTVHDCFRCLPNYGNDLRRQYNNLLHQLAESRILNHILSQITQRDLNIGKLDPTLADDIPSTNYALS